MEVLAHFFVNFYFKLYYDIKVKHYLVDAPLHALTSLKLLRAEPEEVRHIITPYIQSGAWHAHPENLLLSLLASNVEAEREFAVDKILSLRGDKMFGDDSVRPRLTPKLNFGANHVTELIDWESGGALSHHGHSHP